MNKEKLDDLIILIGIICALIAISKILPTWIFVLVTIGSVIYTYFYKSNNEGND